MKETIIVDASVAIKWVFFEEQSEQALALRERFQLAAPELVLSECANILWKKVRRAEFSFDEAAVAARLLANADIELMPMRPLIESALRMAVEFNHPAYDCVYLSAAASRGMRFVTADESLLRKLRQSKPIRPLPTCLNLQDAVSKE